MGRRVWGSAEPIADALLPPASPGTASSAATPRRRRGSPGQGHWLSPEQIEDLFEAEFRAGGLDMPRKQVLDVVNSTGQPPWPDVLGALSLAMDIRSSRVRLHLPALVSYLGVCRSSGTCAAVQAAMNLRPGQAL